jgi:hypothetical protein
LNAGKSGGGFGDTGVAVFESTTGARLPRGIRDNVVDEALAAEAAFGLQSRGRQVERIFAQRFVLGGPANLQHFQARRRFEHAMADGRRLQKVMEVRAKYPPGPAGARGQSSCGVWWQTLPMKRLSSIAVPLRRELPLRSVYG